MTEEKPLNSKQYRNKIDVGSYEMYKAFIDSLDSIEKKTMVIGQKELNSAVHEINRRIMENLIKRNIYAQLPFSLGTIQINKFKKNVNRMDNGRLNLPIDFKNTLEMWKEDPLTEGKYIYHRNLHTGGFVHKFNWKKNITKTKNISSYKFVPVKQVKRNLAQVLKDPLSKVDFYEI